MHGTSSSYIASTLRATRLYIFMHILYQDTTNEYENKQDFFQVVCAINCQISTLGGSPNYDPIIVDTPSGASGGTP